MRAPPGNGVDGLLWVDSERRGEHGSIDHEEVVEVVVTQVRIDDGFPEVPPHRTAPHLVCSHHPDPQLLPRRGVELEELSLGAKDHRFRMKADYPFRAGCELDPRHLLARGPKCLPIRATQRILDSKAAVRSAAQADGAAFISVQKPIDGERDADIDKGKPRKGIHEPRSETSKRRGAPHRMNPLS